MLFSYTWQEILADIWTVVEKSIVLFSRTCWSSLSTLLTSCFGSGDIQTLECDMLWKSQLCWKRQNELGDRAPWKDVNSLLSHNFSCGWKRCKCLLEKATCNSIFVCRCLEGFFLSFFSLGFPVLGQLFLFSCRWNEPCKYICQLRQRCTSLPLLLR